MKLAVCLAFLCGSAWLLAQGIVIKNKNDTNGTDTTPPVVTITVPTTSPTYNAGVATSVFVSGTASDATGVAICNWTTDQAGSGRTTGQEAWSIGAVPLINGTTTLTVSCIDPANNQGTATLAITATTGSCTSTLSAGANIASAASAAAAGSTICLNNGSYGNQTFGAFTKSPRVTVRAVNSLSATMGTVSIQSGSNGLTLDGITITGGDLTIAGSTTKNVTISHCAMGVNELLVNTVNFNNNAIVIDGCTFGPRSAVGQNDEGRLEIKWGGGPGTVAAGVQVMNSTFGPGGCSDGINIGSYGVVVGPGNVFDRIVQSGCDPVHTDSIQGFGQSHTTINGNYFKSSEIAIGFYDGGTNETFTNNLIVGIGAQSVQVGHTANPIFEHNTVTNGTVNFNGKPEQGNSSNLLAQDNVMLTGSSFNINQGSAPACNSCVFLHNLCVTTGVCNLSTNNVIGNPTFVGGTTPTTWAGYQLLSSSLGYQAATSPAGSDMGITYYGP